MDPSAPAGATIAACWAGDDADALRGGARTSPRARRRHRADIGVREYPDILLETPGARPRPAAARASSAATRCSRSSTTTLIDAPGRRSARPTRHPSSSCARSAERTATSPQEATAVPRARCDVVRDGRRVRPPGLIDDEDRRRHPDGVGRDRGAGRRRLRQLHHDDRSGVREHGCTRPRRWRGSPRSSASGTRTTSSRATTTCPA